MEKPSNINNMLTICNQSICVAKDDWVNIMEEGHRLNGLIIEVREKMAAIKVDNKLILLTEKGKLIQPTPFRKCTIEPHVHNLWKLIITE